jgi:cytochrome c oxidase assembly protein subunit 15
MVRATFGKQALMAETAKASKIDLRLVRLWLFAAAAMIFLTLIVGGATRLTESGLSIVEWKPITGVLPPLSENAWQTVPDDPPIPGAQPRHEPGRFQGHLLVGMVASLSGAPTGVIFLLPFLFFLWRGVIPANLRARLWVIFGAGAALGAVGWWMVSSGLTQGVSVSQYRLAFHLTLASAIYAAVLWTAQQLTTQAYSEVPMRVCVGALVIALLLLLQIYLGALVAGLDAGLVYNTWPSIDGAIVPSPERLWFLQPAWRNVFENALTVQFNHRMVAYAIWLLAVLHAFDTWRASHARWSAVVLAAGVTLQAGLGVVTLLYQAPLGLALAHQVLAILVLTIAVVHAERLSHRAIIFAQHAKPAEQGA